MNIKRILIILGIVLGIFAGGYWTGKGQREVIEKTVTIKGDKEIQIVERIIIKERIIRPDGTVEEREINKDRTEDAKESTEIADKESSSRPVANNWGVGGGVKASLKDVVDLQPKLDYVLTGSRRIIGDVWVDLSISTDKQILMGARIEL